MISQFFPQKSLPNFVCTKSKVCRHPPSLNYHFQSRSKLDKSNISVHLQKTIISVRSWRLHLQNLAWPMVQMSRNLAKSGKFIAICDEIFNTKLLALHLSSWEEFSHFAIFFSFSLPPSHPWICIGNSSWFYAFKLYWLYRVCQIFRAIPSWKGENGSGTPCIQNDKR